MATLGELAAARRVAEDVVQRCGGSEEEGWVVAEAVEEYVTTCWDALRLFAIIRDEEAWHRHVVRQAVRIFLKELDMAELGRWASIENPLDHKARAIMRVRADAANLPARPRRLLDAIYVDGLSVRDAAIANGLTVQEACSELNGAWRKVREQFPDLY